MKNKELQKGMTLIEVVIAIVIAAILFGVIYQIFITGNIIFNKAQIEFNLIQNARIAMDWIIRDVRNAESISINANTLTVLASGDSTIVYSILTTSNNSKVLARATSGTPNPITNEEAYLETCTFTSIPPTSGGVRVKFVFQAFNVHAKKKQKGLSGKVPSFSLEERIFVRRIILNSKWGGQ